jgi:hypothetical protein
MRLRNLPTRLATGAFILHSGIEKWSGDKETAEGVHGMASGAFPVIEDVPAPAFLKGLSAGEVAVGAALLAPVVPAATAGAVLTGFSGGLLAMYFRTPGLRKEGSIWPTQQGLGISKDVWMLGIGLGLLLDAVTDRRARAA